jgi:hypothetical protein
VYNVFKRPMFKRGGTAQGSGIMSTVEPKPEPRIMARMGFPTLGLSQAQINPETGMTAYEEMLARQTAPKFAEPRSIPYISGGGFNYMLPSNMTPAQRQMNIKTPTPKENIQGVNEDQFTTGLDEYGPTTEYEQIPKKEMGKFRQNLPEIFQMRPKGTALDKKGIETLIASEDQEGDIFSGLETSTSEPSPKPSPKDTTTTKTGEKRKSLKSEVEADAAELTSLLRDEGYERGELALLVAEALRTPGGINKKLDKARQLGAKVAAGRRGDKKEIIKTAYKYAKERQLAEAKGDDFSRKVAGYVQSNLADPKNTKTAAELTQEAYNKVFRGDESAAKEFSLAQLALLSKQALPDARSDISKYEKKISEGKPLTASEQQKLEEARTVVKRASEFAAISGITTYEKGGRVKLAESFPGTVGDAESKQMEIEATNITQADQSVPMKPVQKLSYTDLRNRLPKEITDDIIQLMSKSEEALQDFAYIKTQEDINAFNVKYGVNLMLPPQTL